jgi:hypothetical protein
MPANGRWDLIQGLKGEAYQFGKEIKRIPTV